MRMTQYIGLTLEAKKFVANASVQTNPKMTSGMFEEDVSGSIFEMLDGETLTEVEQCSPWSSGPMIFTCLKNSKGELLFKWIEDSSVRNLVDCENGRYYV